MRASDDSAHFPFFLITLKAQSAPGEEDYWCCSENQDRSRKTCDVPEELNVPQYEVQTDDSILNRVMNVVNKRTRRSRLVKGCAVVKMFDHGKDECLLVVRKDSVIAMKRARF